MSNSRDLNFIAIDQILESGHGQLGNAEVLLINLVKTMSASAVNDNLAYIVRMHELEIPCGEELAKCEDRS